MRRAFFAAIVRPLVLVLIGLQVRRAEGLPREGPALIVANHNSHLDTLVLMSILPLDVLPRVRPVAAADYFLATPARAWFARRVMDIVPVDREFARGEDPLAGCREALAEGSILIVYPEGTRGEPEERGRLRRGVARLAAAFPAAPTVPVFLHGLGKVLPRGDFVPIPFFCDVYVGEPIAWTGDRRAYMAALEESLDALAAEETHPDWE